VLAVLLLGAAQLLLPGIAAQRLRSQLSQHGQVEQVRVAAFPAVELLWGRADSVTIRMRNYGLGSGGSGLAGLDPAHRPWVNAAAVTTSRQRQVGDVLASTAQANNLTLGIGRVRSGRLVLEHVRLIKRGAALNASATLTPAALAAALPQPFTLQPLASPDGQLLFRAGVSVLGAGATVEGRLVAHQGAILIEPNLGQQYSQLVSVTVFRDPRVYVSAVHSRQVAGGWQISGRGHLTGS
jgi:hypothetical protein